MKIILTGATGFIGRPLMKALLKRDHELVVLTRDPERAADQLSFPCELRRWDPMGAEPPPLDKDSEAIIHLAGEPVSEGRWTDEKKKRILDSRVVSTKRLVEALGRARDHALRTFVSASAIGYYGDRGDEVLSESSPRGAGFLSNVCGAWEDALHKGMPAGIRTAVLRIGIVLGTEGGAFRELYPVFHSGVGGKVGSGRQWMSWIHLDDAVALVVRAVEREDMAGPYNLTAPGAVTNTEFASAFGLAVGMPAVIPAPAVALKLALGEKAAIVLEGQRVLPKRALEAGFGFRYPDLASALQNLCAWKRNVQHYSEQWVPQDVDDVFRFFSNPANLASLTPPSFGFTLMSQSSRELADGTLIEYKIRVAGVPIVWQSRIENWRRGEGFTDVQTRGPYSEWVHDHGFEALAGGTLITDRVRYRVPLGSLGQAVAGSSVQKTITDVFDYRRKTLQKLWHARTRV